MNDIAERFKYTTIPAITIEGYEDGKPFAMNTLVWKVDEIIHELAELLVEPKTPDFDDEEAFDKFDWPGHDDRIEAQRAKITAEILGIAWEHMSEEDKKISYWDEDYDEFVTAEMTAFFTAIRAAEKAEEDRLDAEIEEEFAKKDAVLQAQCDEANAKNAARKADGS